MYFLILLGAVVSVLKLMRFEPVVDWSWYSLSMAFVFLLLWLVLARIRRNRKKIEKNANENDIDSNDADQPEVGAWGNIHEWERNRQ